MDLITNGSMYFDPHLHTLSYVRSRSSYLLAVILAIASSHISLNLSRRLHDELFLHVQRLEIDVIRNNNKSVEIVQAYLLLASWSDVPTVLARDRTWTYIARAIGMAVELRLDCPLPHCIQSDPMYSMSTKDILVRNAHRVCYLLFIHDRVSITRDDSYSCSRSEHGHGSRTVSCLSRGGHILLHGLEQVGQPSSR